MWPNPQFPEDLVTLIEEILKGKLYFWCSVTLGFIKFGWFLFRFKYNKSKQIIFSHLPNLKQADKYNKSKQIIFSHLPNLK